MLIIGIDPGKKGAIVEIDTNEKHVRWMVLPYREDGMLLKRTIRENFSLGFAHRIAIEQVGFIKGAMGSATFGFGVSYGQAFSMLEDYPYDLVRPQAWHKLINGSKLPDETRTTKMRSAASFIRLNPTFGKIVKEHHEGMIDAFFIAYYCGLHNSVVMPSGFSFERIP